MKRWTALPTRWIRSRSAVGLALLALAGCAPRRAPVPAGLPPREPTIAVGLAVDTSRIELGAPSSFDLLGPGGQTIATLAAGEQLSIEATPGSELIAHLASRSLPVGPSLRVRARGGIVEIGGRSYRGSALVRASAPGRLTVINEVELEEYLLGVVPFEIGRVGPELLEAAKAQAVAARTYAIRYLGRRRALGFDVLATVADQVYGGAAGEDETVSRAVRETSGEILTYAGQPIEALYHSTCAGRTAAIEEVWPDEAPRPYLVSVIDIDPSTGQAFDIGSSRFRWTQRWTAEELHSILERTLADSLPPTVTALGPLEDLQVLARTASGRVKVLRITTGSGQYEVGGDRVRWILPTPGGQILNSSLFELALERDPGGRIRGVVAEGMGWGHGIGMCQVGAMGRARAGQGYRTILDTYYPGTELLRLY